MNRAMLSGWNRSSECDARTLYKQVKSVNVTNPLKSPSKAKASTYFPNRVSRIVEPLSNSKRHEVGDSEKHH